MIIGSFIHVKGIYLFSLHLTSLSPPHRIGEEEVSCCKNKGKYAKLKKNRGKCAVRVENENSNAIGPKKTWNQIGLHMYTVKSLHRKNKTSYNLGRYEYFHKRQLDATPISISKRIRSMLE